MNAPTDMSLMQQVQGGDLRKMGVLYQRYNRKLFGYFYKMNGDAALSEDLVQNLFIRLIDYRHTFSGSGSFASWVFRTARNLQYDHFKANGKHPVSYTGEPWQLSKSAAVLAEDEGVREGLIRDLRNAMDSLPAEQREILVLSKLRGLTFIEIASILDCTEGAAKVRAHRALKALREIMIKTVE
ncbi:RNA polymerase sigma-70 factor, ECF subfamily [Robiginitalea myxolifaciens]|uniref:RNA polymerase sigma-70 factor, ECF subfamily n=1 Tax=Robiginitalea myxolifaciens TaxID=400055 RepID=A0A1I6FUD6_9FLAO|nr:RNA polymerase sigma factor [Robiginitalea myxolifaciens]SFR33427.1 RNA polymerase sigma-70 factor, ECF subfamily [Robiginitalea myxolifaciens]